MKKLLFLLLTINCSLLTVHAQWQPDVRLTNDTAASYTSINNAWCVASNGNTVHVVWWDDRDRGNGFTEIYYKRSSDAGVSWGADVRLTNDPNTSKYPSVAVAGSVVHVVWSDVRDGNWEIYYKRSTDGGLTWGADVRLTNNSFGSNNPSVAVNGSAVHVVWHDNRDGNDEVYYKRSTDGGITWGADTRLTNDPASSWFVSVAVSGLNVHIAWSDLRIGNWEIYYKRSTDGGTSWGADTRLTFTNPLPALRSSIAVSGSVVHVVWQDGRPNVGPYEIYYKRSTDGGTNWGADIQLTSAINDSYSPNVAVSGSNVHVVWFDFRDGNLIEIYYKRSTDGGTSWGADVRLTNDPAPSQYESVAVSGSVVHVVWQDFRDGNHEIYYKRDPLGNPVGIINISNEIPNHFSLSQNYPNPFNPSTKIQFALPKSSVATLVIYDALGREIETLVNEQLYAGTYEADWSADKFSSGAYYYKLSAGDYAETKKMVLMK